MPSALNLKIHGSISVKVNRGHIGSEPNRAEFMTVDDSRIDVLTVLEGLKST